MSWGNTLTVASKDVLVDQQDLGVVEHAYLITAVDPVGIANQATIGESGVYNRFGDKPATFVGI